MRARGRRLGCIFIASELFVRLQGYIPLKGEGVKYFNPRYACSKTDRLTINPAYITMFIMLSAHDMFSLGYKWITEGWHQVMHSDFPSNESGYLRCLRNICRLRVRQRILCIASTHPSFSDILCGWTYKGNKELGIPIRSRVTIKELGKAMWCVRLWGVSTAKTGVLWRAKQRRESGLLHTFDSLIWSTIIFLWEELIFLIIVGEILKTTSSLPSPCPSHQCIS